MAYQQLSVRIPADLAQSLDDLCYTQKRTKTGAIVEAIEAWIRSQSEKS